MRLRNLKNRDEIVMNCSFLLDDPKKYKGKFCELFGNNNPINLEIGMGKGDFIYNMAKTYPDINFIGVEKYANVLARAIVKMDKVLPNLYIMNYDAIKLGEVFEHEIDTIYLNFSDPWPKKRHARRRLTSEDFLRVYDDLFVGRKRIVQKTDNIDLFSYSLVTLSNYGYVFNDVSLDLHNSDRFNIETEYETKFSNLGYKINYLEATKK